MSTTIKIVDINVNGNVRHDLADVGALAASIEHVGLLNPVTVTLNDDDGYTLLAGHRRLAAVQSLGWDSIPVHIVTEQQRTLQQLAENVQRDELDRYELAQAFLELKDDGITQKEIAAATGIKSKEIGQVRKLANLEPQHYKLVEQASLDDQLELAAIADDPELLDRVVEVASQSRWGHVRGWIGTAQAQRDLDKAWAEITPKLDALRDQGIEVIGSREESGQAPGSWLSLSSDFIDIKAHVAEPCHVMVVTKAYRGPSVAAYCKSKSRHLPSGKSELKFDDAEARTEALAERKQENKENRYRKEAQRNVLSSVLKDVTKISHGRFIELLAGAYLDAVWREHQTAAAALLDIQVTDEWNSARDAVTERGKEGIAAAVLVQLIGHRPATFALAFLNEIGVDWEQAVAAELQELLADD